jgi:hypothetical protein
VALALLFSSWSGAADSKTARPVLISPYFGPVFVTFAGFGEIGGVLKPRLVTGSEARGAMWLRLHNNTIWPIVVDTGGGYAVSGTDWAAGSVLKEWMQTTIRYSIEDERGRPIPEEDEQGKPIPEALEDEPGWGGPIARSELAPGRSVLFRVTPAALKTGQRIYITYRYAWEPDGYVAEYQSRVDQRVVVGSGIVPSPETK